MEKSYAICASCATVGDFKKLIEDLPNDYKVSCIGSDEFFINVFVKHGAVVIDDSHLIDCFTDVDEK